MGIFKKVYYLLSDLVQTFVIAGAIFVVIYAFLFRPYQVNGHSMDPTFNNGEYVLTNLITLRFSALKKGDVVVFKEPIRKQKDFIKRIIGVPGDQVMVENGKVYVNQKLLDESEYLETSVYTGGGAFLNEGQSVIVPQGAYFAMGDNRSQSSDSREWGFVPKELIIGKSYFVYWPPTLMRVVKHVDLQ